MRESCTYGSVRGARGNSRPYRDFEPAGVLGSVVELQPSGNAPGFGGWECLVVRG
jgi:hypothetical protein